MTTRTKATGFLVLIIASACLAFRALRPTEPTYKGHPLSFWIEEYRVENQLSQNDELAPRRTAEARTAILAIGPEGLPFLVKWMRYRPRLWGTRFLTWAPYRFRNKVDLAMFAQARANRGEAAMEALEELGTNAAPAIPELAALAMRANGNNKDYFTRYIAMRAARAMSSLGPEALPAMLNLLSKVPKTERVFISTVMARSLHGLEGRENLPWLLQAMRTPYGWLNSLHLTPSAVSPPNSSPTLPPNNPLRPLRLLAAIPFQN